MNLQELISKGGFVYLPDGLHIVDKPLIIGSDTHIICSPKCIIKLGDFANCPIMINDGTPENPTENITIDGGVWDGNNENQEREKYLNPFYNFGQFTAFCYVKNLTVKNLRIKDPNGYCIQITDCDGFTIRDIVFDCNKKTLNQDGVHINGRTTNGYIANLKGETNDDFVALNSDEGFFASENNDIENIVIDGIYGGNDGWTGVRLLSREASVKNITIKNIFGAYKFNAVSFTHWGEPNMNYGYFDNIYISGVYATSTRNEGTGHGGLIWFQDEVQNVGTVVIKDYFRSEDAEKLNETNLIHFGKKVKIKNLYLSRLFEDIPQNKKRFFCDDTSNVENLVIDGISQDYKEFKKDFN